MWGVQVVVPAKLYVKLVLDELHQGDLGVIQMKTLARSYIRWHKLEEEVKGEQRLAPRV